MSTFEASEVDALARTGNAFAAATWLGKLTREQIVKMAPPSTAAPTVCTPGAPNKRQTSDPTGHTVLLRPLLLKLLCRSSSMSIKRAR